LLGKPRSLPRTVEVLPPSHGEEASWVFLSAAFVCLCVIYMLAFQRGPAVPAAGGARSAPAARPVMVLFRDLPGNEQRVFREMQEGLQEALRRRGMGGEWPSVTSLAGLDIPPFARDALDTSGLSWTQQRDGLLVEYIGVPPPGAGIPAFLISIQEPEPTGGEQPSAAVVDEEHQLLPDGKLLHVTYWKRSSESLQPGMASNPALQGWTQIRVTDPFQMLEAALK
jgi:hypothetical protein